MMFSDDNAEKESHADVDDDIENADPDQLDQSQDCPNNEKAPRESKNRRRNKKKKLRAKQRQAEIREKQEKTEVVEEKANLFDDVEVEYIQDTLNLDPSDPTYGQFLRIFKTFQLSEPDQQKTNGGKVNVDESTRKIPKDIVEVEEEEPEEEKKDEAQKLSKRKLKQLNRLTVAELKQNVARPDVVEMHDVTARDPKLLVQLKAARNTVPVPRHWCFKRKYLQGKRGIEKPPFNLPDFIKRTGIMEMRQALQEKEDQKTLKTKMREKVRPRLGKIDIDYQKLHDAFFRWQTKPRLTKHGELYYEGKEFETRLHEKKPGELTDDLKTALGMPVGQGSHNVPPPWLIAMQRYGPPPSYPILKIPGLNCPIPESCSYGYHAGGWGKPPVDEAGRPLYGDVFGTDGDYFDAAALDEDIDRTLWGEYETDSGSDSEEEEEEQEDNEMDVSGLITPIDGLATPSGTESIPAGMETPDMIELRKKKIENDMEGNEVGTLYTILPEKKVDRVGAALMGSMHTYELAAATAGNKNSASTAITNAHGQVELALDPSELNLDSAEIAVRYEQTIREQQNQLAKEDLSDMVAEHSAKQKMRNKRKHQPESSKSEKNAKKYKDFKF